MNEPLLRRAWRGLTRNVAYTSADAADPRLRGRTYAVPFEDVWQAALQLVAELRRWELVEHDDREGIIRAVAHARLQRLAAGVTVRVGLDVNAQTRVDVMSASRHGVADLGSNVRRIGRFLGALDRSVERARALRRQSARSA